MLHPKTLSRFNARAFLTVQLPALLRAWNRGPKRIIRFVLTGPRGGTWDVALDGQHPVDATPDLVATMSIPDFETIMTKPVENLLQWRASGRIVLDGERSLLAVVAEALESPCDA